MATSLAAVGGPAKTAATARRARSRGELLAFCGMLLLLVVASLALIAQIGMTGDEPWYVLQGYSLLHNHTVDMTAVLHDRRIYGQLLASLPPDHVSDYRGNGVLVVPYLPGYSLFAGLLYLLGGRFLIVVAQAALVACLGTALLREARRLWRSRAAALFAVLAFLASLPALLYVGQVFPSTLAAAAAFGSFALVARALPAAKGRRLALASGAVGALAAAAPWLHVRYATLAVAIVAGALLQLASAAKARGAGRHGDVRAAVALVCAPPLASLALIVLYSRRYFGTWYPQYHSLGNEAYAGFDLARVARLYGEVLLDRTSGLIPWAPLMLLAPLGWALLARARRRYALLLLLWVAGVQATFFSAAFAPLVGQAYALPARFTVECQPFLALCVAALFAESWPRLRQSVGRLRAGGPHAAIDWRGMAALACLALLAVDAWFTLVALRAPALLYPSAAGARLVAAFPHLLPGWWFNLFAVHPA